MNDKVEKVEEMKASSPTKQIMVKMSKEEQEAYLALSEEEKTAYKEKMLAKKQKVTFISVVLAQLMLENIDDMESFNLIQGKLKVTTRQYKTQMNAFLNKVFGKGKISNEDTNILTEISASMEKLIDNHYDKIEKV